MQKEQKGEPALKLVDTRSQEATVGYRPESIATGLPNLVIDGGGQIVAGFKDKETAQSWFKQETGHDNFTGKQLEGAAER